VYWDSFGYVAQAVSGQIGGLGLGRPLFVLISHAVATAIRATGAPVFTVEPVLRLFWLAVSAAAAPLTLTLARECGLSTRASLFAGLAVALSLPLAHVSASVLTDGPSLALSLGALVLGVRAIRSDVSSGWLGLATGVVLGAACGLREQCAANLLILGLFVAAAPSERRWRLAAGLSLGFVCAAGLPILYAYLTQADYLSSISRWLQGMAREREQQPYRATDFFFYLLWLVALGPATLLFALSAWTTELRRPIWTVTPLRAIAVVSMIQLLLLAGYQDISYSPRYLLGTFPGALALPAGAALDRFSGESFRRSVAAFLLLALPFTIAAPVVRWLEQPTRSAIDALPALLARVPAGSVIVTGQPCPAIDLYDRLSRVESGLSAPTWQQVCPGWTWPDDLGARLDTALREERTIVIDARDGAWLGRGQRAARDEALRYADHHPSELAARRIRVWRSSPGGTR